MDGCAGGRLYIFLSTFHLYGEGESQPKVLARFKATSELDQCKKMMDMEGSLN